MRCGIRVNVPVVPVRCDRVVLFALNAMILVSFLTVLVVVAQMGVDKLHGYCLESAVFQHYYAYRDGAAWVGLACLG